MTPDCKLWFANSVQSDVHLQVSFNKSNTFSGAMNWIHKGSVTNDKHLQNSDFSDNMPNHPKHTFTNDFIFHTNYPRLHLSMVCSASSKSPPTPFVDPTRWPLQVILDLPVSWCSPHQQPNPAQNWGHVSVTLSPKDIGSYITLAS